MIITGGLTFSGGLSLYSPAPAATYPANYLIVGGGGGGGGGVALRGNYAGIGYHYDSVHDVFYPPQPYNSWTIGPETNWVWRAPIDYPTDGKRHIWNEAMTNWVEVIDPA